MKPREFPMTRPPTEAAYSAGWPLRLLLSSALASLVHSAAISRKMTRVSRLLAVRAIDKHSSAYLINFCQSAIVVSELKKCPGTVAGSGSLGCLRGEPEVKPPRPCVGHQLA
jgi:hypothetical protein